MAGGEPNKHEVPPWETAVPRQPTPQAHPPQPYPQQPYPQQPYPQQPYASPYPQPGMSPMVYQATKPYSGLAVASMVCAGVGFVLGVPWLVGIVLGILALRATGPTGTRNGRGLAIAGIATNAVLLVGAVAVFALATVTLDKAKNAVKFHQESQLDASLIAQRAAVAVAHGADLRNRGWVFHNDQKGAPVEGPVQVPHLVAADELRLPRENYELVFAGEVIWVWYTHENGQRVQLLGFLADDPRQQRDPPGRGRR